MIRYRDIRRHYQTGYLNKGNDIAAMRDSMVAEGLTGISPRQFIIAAAQYRGVDPNEALAAAALAARGDVDLFDAGNPSNIALLQRILDGLAAKQKKGRNTMYLGLAAVAVVGLIWFWPRRKTS
jgi:hypothetical protein